MKYLFATLCAASGLLFATGCGENGSSKPASCADNEGCPADQYCQTQTGRGICVKGEDSDGDGWIDQRDNCPEAINEDQKDTDGNGVGDACEECEFDTDDDGICDSDDECPTDKDNDKDGDGKCAGDDNCPDAANPQQEDADADGAGDVCDPCPGDAANDSDGDGKCAGEDNCPDAANPRQEDADADGAGDACDACPYDDANDADADGKCAGDDNCPDVANPQQEDADADGHGDICDPCPNDPDDDADADGRCADEDNCPDVANPQQEDMDADGAGDACDNCPDISNPGQDPTACQAQAETEPNHGQDENGNDIFNSVTAPGVVSGRIDEPLDDTPDWDVFQFEATAGSVLDMTLDTSAGLMDGAFFVYGAEEATADLIRFAIDPTSTAAHRQILVTATGKYMAVVYDDTNVHFDPFFGIVQESFDPVGGDQYPYTLKINALPLDTLARPVDVLPFDSTGRLEPAGDVAVYAVTLPASSRLLCEVTAQRLQAPSDLDSALYLYDPVSGRMLARNDDLSEVISDSRFLAYTAAENPHYVILDSQDLTEDAAGFIDLDGDGTLDFSYGISISVQTENVEVEPNDWPQTANPILVPGEITGKISAPEDKNDDGEEEDDVDVFSFDAEAGTFIDFTIEAAANGSELDSLIVILDAEGNTICVNDDSHEAVVESRCEFLAATTGRHYAVVIDARNADDPVTPEEEESQHAGGDTFTYTLKAAVSTPQIDALGDLPAQREGESFDPGTSAYYSLDASAGEKVSLLLDTVEGSLLRPFAVIYGTDGHTPLAFAAAADQGGDGAIEGWFALEDGAYLISVTDYYGRGGAGFTYDLSVSSVAYSIADESEPNNEIATSNPVSGGLLVRASLDSEADPADFFKITAGIGDKISVSTHPAPQDEVRDTVLYILDADGNELAKNDDVDLFDENYYSAIAGFEAPVMGDYFIKVEPYSGLKGNYLLEVDLESAETVAPVAGNVLINEVLYDPPAGLAGDANGDGLRDDQSHDDEFVEIVNISGGLLDLAGVMIRDRQNLRHTFPALARLVPGQAAVVFGGGTPVGEFGGSLASTASTGKLDLGNSGDDVTLLDAAGTQLDTMTWTNSDPNCSFNRERDADPAAAFVKHKVIAAAAGALFSPGTKVNAGDFQRSIEPCYYAVDASEGGTFEGDTSLLSDNFHASCGNGTLEPDTVFKITLDGDSPLTLTVTPEGGWHAVVFLLDACGEAAAALACSDTGYFAGTTMLVVENLAAGTYYAVVDGYGPADADRGPFELSVKFSPFVPPPLNDKCEGAVLLAGGAAENGTTEGAANDYEPPSECTGFAPEGPDVVYKVALASGQTLTATVTPHGDWDVSVYLLGAACDPSACLAGVDEGYGGGAETLTYTAGSDGTYMIVIDSYSASSFGEFDIGVLVE